MAARDLDRGFRGSARMYATDGLARMSGREAERLGHMGQAGHGLVRLFAACPGRIPAVR